MTNATLASQSLKLLLLLLLLMKNCNPLDDLGAYCIIIFLRTIYGNARARILAGVWWPRKERPVFLSMRAEERAKIRAEFTRRRCDVGAIPARRRRDNGAIWWPRKEMLVFLVMRAVLVLSRFLIIPPHSGGIFSSEFTSLCLFSVYFEAPLLAQIF